MGLGKSVFFSKKFFRVEEIPRLLKGAVAGIIPNRKDRATEYMLPVKLLEYVYTGIPVIAPRLKTIQYYFDEKSIAYYDPGNVLQLSHQMSVLWKNFSCGLEISLNAQERMASLNWQSMKGSLFEVVDN